jgi:hypothetical protein
MTSRNTLTCLLVVLTTVLGIAGAAPAVASRACDGAVDVRNGVAGSALILSHDRLENLRYGREALLGGNRSLTPAGRRVANDPRLLSPYASAMDAQRGRCPASTFQATNPPQEDCGGGHDLCCDNTGDLEELLCIADLISLCTDASNCTLIPGSGSQGPVCVCN